MDEKRELEQTICKIAAKNLELEDRSSSLKSHKTVTKTPDINQPVNQSTSTNQANHLFP